MHKKFILLLLTVILLTGTSVSYAEPRMPKRCAKKVLLPGQNKYMKCRKARNLKNNYF
ncbi:MAG: hypothetical protein U0T77_05565 [Chitinophagales bacterium]